MGSFYPGGGGGAGGSDYNKMKNVPVMNLTGTDTVPVYLGSLDYGAYRISSYYKRSTDGKILEFTEPTMVYVVNDKTTNEKVATYQEIRNGETYIITVTYKSNGKVIVNETAISEAHLVWKTFD